MADRIIFVSMIVLTGVYFWATSQIPTLEIGDPLGPKAFPRLLGGGMIIAAVMLLLEMIKANTEKARAAKTEASKSYDITQVKIISGVTVVVAIYFYSFEPLGYAVSTSLFMLVMTNYFNKRKWWTNSLTSVLYGFGSYYAFTQLLGVSLPRGIAPF